MRNILVLGHSHVGAIRDAAIARRETKAGNSWTRTIYALDPRFGDPTGERFNAAHMPPALLSEVRRQIDVHKPLVASALGGNTHTLISLVRDDDPFDFMLSGEPSPRIDPTARILPEAYVRDRLVAVMQPDIVRLTRLRKEIGPFWHIESPPPVAARSFIAKRIEPYFSNMPEFERNGISPGGLRYRMWRLASRVLKQHCRAMGCGYVPVPRAVLDASGFLAQTYANDSTHGNQRYGDQVIAELEQLAMSPTWRRHLHLKTASIKARIAQLSI